MQLVLQESHSKTKSETLGEEKVPNFGGKTRAQEPRSLEKYTNKQSNLRAKLSSADGRNGRYNKRHRDGKSAHKSIVEGSCTRKCIVGEIVCQEDSIRLGELVADQRLKKKALRPYTVHTPRVSIDQKCTPYAYPAITSIWWHVLLHLGFCRLL
jgi:hypothetical protein